MGTKFLATMVAGFLLGNINAVAGLEKMMPPAPALGGPNGTTPMSPNPVRAVPRPSIPARAMSENSKRSKSHRTKNKIVASAKQTIGSNLPSVVDSRNLFDEAKNLIIPNQKYLLQFEDEESFGRLTSKGKEDTTVVFSDSEVEKFRQAAQTISSYRAQVKQRCSGQSETFLIQALDNYSASLAAFNRRALPLVADISENNNLMILLVNRTTLVDAPVLVSRYLKYKKQRFKENMGRFLTTDNQLVESMVTIADILKSEVSDRDWNKSYAVRDNALEQISLWPRKPIFEATARLSEMRERACVVDNIPVSDQKEQISTTLPPAPAAAE